MKKFSFLLILGILFSACQQGADQHTNVVNEEISDSVVLDTIPRVTGVGGIFFGSENPEELRKWYGTHLGLAIDDYGSPFEFRNALRPDEVNYLRWSPAKSGSAFFDSLDKELIINYRVNNIEGLVRKLESKGIEMLDSIQDYPYGRFVHLMDPEGYKIELWEPVDSVLTAMGGVTTK